MPIIAMTRERGSLGTYIGQEVARRLGYEFIRDEIIAAAAQVYDAVEEKLVDTVESKPGFWEGLGEAARRHFTFVAAEVFRFAERDRVVIMGRWSTLLLKGVGHAIRIRVCAPVPVRVKRLMERMGISEEEARQFVERADRGVRSRIAQFFDVHWEDPELFDLVINTEHLSIDEGARLILQLAESPTFQPSEASQGALRNLGLAAAVRATLKVRPETTRLNVGIEATDGRLRLGGTVFSREAKRLAEGVAKEVEGVQAVENHLTVVERKLP